MPRGRPSKPDVPEDASCLSLDLLANVQCITCKRERRQADGVCKKPWTDRWLKTAKESDYMEAWEQLQNNYRLPQPCRNARARIKKASKSKDKSNNERRPRVSRCL